MQFPIKVYHPDYPGKLLTARDQEHLERLMNLGWKPAPPVLQEAAQ